MFYLIFAQNIDHGYTLEPPHWGGSNEYPWSKFLSKNVKIMYNPCKPQSHYTKVGCKECSLHGHVILIILIISQIVNKRWFSWKWRFRYMNKAVLLRNIYLTLTLKRLGMNKVNGGDEVKINNRQRTVHCREGSMAIIDFYLVISF